MERPAPQESSRDVPVASRARNVFITGATGVVGRRVVPLLRAHGHVVTAVARSTAADRALESAGARAVRADLLDRAALERVLRDQHVVINLATHMPSSTVRMLLPGAWRENDRLRRDGSRTLAEAARACGVERFVQESFAPAYPDCGARWIDEDVAIAPVRYNRTIADAEQSARRFTEQGGTGVVLRFAAFYGPDAFQSLDLAKLVRKGFAPLPGSPEAYISSVSHDDAASAVVAALRAPAGAYNVSDDEPLRHRAFVDAIAAALGAASPRLPAPWMTRLMGSVGEMLARSQRISNRKLKDATKWSPRYASVREGWPIVARSL
ncbi:MAG TPA: NAD(P)-dependent oxidoreductase [Casimicrobiaceae bacterium]|jgi:2-alkyl-3-oxoalkanoate reductase|nr:NAD(P)-dependent oxidoreductase [Casimicrobiaceae bacterium]